MEKENSFLNMNWSAVEAPLGYALSNQLQQSFITHFNSSLSTIGHLDGFGASVCATLQPQQWSSTTSTDRFSSHSLNSTPKLNLSLVSQEGQMSPFVQGDAGFTERAANMSCFSLGIPNYGTQFPLSETGRLPRGLGLVVPVESNNEILMPSRSSTGEEVELRCIRAESSASEHTVNESNERKRKLIKVGEEGSEANAKRSRVNETGKSGKDEAKPKVEVDAAKGEKPQKEEGAKEAEAPKQDYIHVRARRGQATDAHSLAERVRREKISERMKFLQNLVPGCNKVTGKAVMLDEIINYVQSLQRQVEFLSMKLATVNPKLDINVETLRQKDMHQTCGSASRTVYAMETAPFPFAHQPPQGTYLQGITSNGMENHCSSNPLGPMLTRRSLGVQLPMLDGSTNAGSQVGGFWGDDLHRVVQMGSGQNQDGDKEFNGEYNS